MLEIQSRMIHYSVYNTERLGNMDFSTASSAKRFFQCNIAFSHGSSAFYWALRYQLLRSTFSRWTGQLLSLRMFSFMRIEMYASVRMQNKGALFKELMESMHTFFFLTASHQKNICWWCLRKHSWFLSILFHLVKLLCCNCGLSLNWKKKKTHGQEAS